MGAAFGWRCYSTPEAAADAMWGGVGPVLSAGSTPSRTLMVKDGDTWVQQTYTGDALTGSSIAVVPAFAPCDPVDSVADGITLGACVLGAWALTWGVRWLANAVR